MITRTSVALADALRMIDAAKARAVELGITVSVAVVDSGGLLVALQTMDGTQGAGADVAVAKARAAVLFRRPTSSFEEVSARLDKPAILLLTSAVPHALPVSGGVPVMVDGQVDAAGAVGVSGGSGAQDEDVATRAIAPV